MRLSLLSVSAGEPHSKACLQALQAQAAEIGAEFVVYLDYPPSGALEYVLDKALTLCGGDYILRLDDDEAMTPAMVEWLKAGLYTGVDHWKFPRLNLWGGESHALKTPPLWPDHQTRLSVRAKAGGRRTIHAGSPFGGGELAPCAILHKKFLLKSYAERKAITERYERLQKGAGLAVFSVPEDVLTPAQLSDTFTFGSGFVATEAEKKRATHTSFGN